MFKIQRKIIGVASLGATYVATLTVLISTSALGTPIGHRELHPAICHYKYDDVGSTLDNSGALTNNSTTTSRSVYCPIHSDDALDVDDVSAVEVVGDEGNNGAGSTACAHYPLTGLFTCSTLGAWGSSLTVTTLSPNWSSVGFAYMRHDLTPGSSLFGMRLQD